MTFDFAGAGDVSVLLSAVILAIVGVRACWLVLTPGGRTLIRDDSRLATSLMICAFCVGIALLTGLVRLSINDGQASRYAVVPIMFLAAMPGVFRREFALPPHVAVSRQLAGAFVIVLVILSVASNLRLVDKVHDRHYRTKVGAIMAEYNVHMRRSGLLPLHPKAEPVRRVWTAHRARRSGIVDWEPFLWRGEQLDALFAETRGGECGGSLDQVRPIEESDGARLITGWARAGTMLERAVEWVVAVDKAGTVVGLAAIGQRRADVRRHLDRHYGGVRHEDAGRAGFRGVVRLPAGEYVELYAILPDQRACRFARTKIAVRSGS